MAKDGQIITFYSYKGGTGRTMSVANTACLLARRLAANGPDGRVLAIDWDFEAPGLHRYFLPYIASDQRRVFNEAPGCIDLLSDVGAQGPEFKHDNFQNREIAKALLSKIDFDRHVLSTTIPGLAIIKSGRHDSAYAQRVNAFDWETFFYSTEGFFPGLADFLRERFDYVLIDSRTGVTDTSGICTMLLPDKLVVPFTANSQSLTGIEDVVRRAVNYRKQSEDWRPLSIFPLPSRIDISRPKLAEQWRRGGFGEDQPADSERPGEALTGYQPAFERLFNELFGHETGDLTQYFDEVVLQHVPDYAYGEPIAVELEGTESRIFLRRSYEAFVDRLTELSTPWESLDQARSDRELAALVEDARKRLDQAAQTRDRQTIEEMIRLGMRLTERKLHAGNIQNIAAAAIDIAQAAIQANPSAATLLATSVLDQVAKFSDDDDWRIYDAVLRRTGKLFDDAALYDRAESCRQMRLDLLSRHLGENHAAVLSAMEELAATISARGETARALKLQERVVEMRRATLGEAHRDTLASTNVLAAMLHRLGDIDRARELRERVDAANQPRGALQDRHAARQADWSSVRVVRVFVSSPGDVLPERQRIEWVLQRLSNDFADLVRFETIRWETDFYQADHTFQSQIIGPAEADIALFLFWKRMGTALPPERYRREDGTPYISATELEFDQAIESAQERGRPDIFVFRKTTQIFFSAENVDEERAQLAALDTFWTRWFRSESGQFKTTYQTFESVDDLEVLVERIARNWLGLHEDKLWRIETQGSPFRGLEPFDQAHAAVFFGRSREIEAIRARLANAQSRGCTFLLLLGAAGVGKSSLVRAGLAPRLMMPGALPEVELHGPPVMFAPRDLGPDVCSVIARLLLSHLAQPGVIEVRESEELAQQLRAEPEQAIEMIRAGLERISSREGARVGRERLPPLRLLVFVDDLEGILDLSADDRHHLVRILDALARSTIAFVVAIARSDFYAGLQAIPELSRLKEDGGQFDLAPPGSAALHEMVEGPARAAGLSFEVNPRTGESLQERLIADAEGPDALPLIQFTLSELYASREHDNQLTFAAYGRIGGVDGAVEKLGEQIFGEVSDAARSSLPTVLRALVRLDEDDRLALIAAPWERVAPTAPARELVDRLIARRLVVTDADNDSANPMLHIAHEALLHHWPRASAIIAQNRETLHASRRIEQRALDWWRHNQSEELLMPAGQQLTAAKQIITEFHQMLSYETRNYIMTSLLYQRRRRWRGYLMGTTAVVIALVGLALSNYYIISTATEQNVTEARERELAVTETFVEAAEILAKADPASAAPLIARAVRIAREQAAVLPGNPRIQDNLNQLMKLCQSVSCGAP